MSAGENGVLSAISALDGAEKWRANSAAPIRVAPVIFNTPDGVRIAVFTDTGKAQAYDASGKADPKWAFTLGATGVAPSASPLLSDDGKTMYVAADDLTLYAIDTATGRVRKTFALGAKTTDTPALFGDLMAINSGASVSLVNTKTGRSVWTSTIEKGVAKGSPSGNIENGKGTIYIGTDRDLLLALDAATGKTLWQTDLDAQVTGSPLVTPTSVLVGTSKGIVYSVDPKSGAVQWSYRLRSEREQPAYDRTGSNRGGNNSRGGNQGGNNSRGNRGGGNQRRRQSAAVVAAAETWAAGTSAADAALSAAADLAAARRPKRWFTACRRRRLLSMGKFSCWPITRRCMRLAKPRSTPSRHAFCSRRSRSTAAKANNIRSSFPTAAP